MFGKVILALAFIAFLSLPLAQSLKCWTCADEMSCKNPASVVCDQRYANVTREVMKRYYNGVKHLNSTDYSCMISRYHNTITTTMDIRGCIMNGAVDCGFQLVNQTWTKDTCKVCRNDSCNFRNSVGTSSSSFIIMATLLVLTKAFIV